MPHLLYLPLIVLACCACKVPPNGESGVPDTNGHIRFDRPAVGQCSYFVHRQKIGPDSNYETLPDTLEARIIDQVAADVFLIEETISAHSDAYRSAPQPVSYHLRIAEGQIQYERRRIGRSILFGQFTKALPLRPIPQPEVASLEFEQQIPGGQFGSYQFGTAKNTTVQGQTYEQLNVVKNAAAMAYDGPGELIAYSAAAGVVKVISFGAMIQRTDAWERLPSGE